MLYFLCWLISFFSIFLFRKVAFKIKFLDYPDQERKFHKDPIPLVGGLGIYLGFAFIFLFHIKFLREFLPLFLSSTIILILGILDDFKKNYLSAQTRFVLEVAISLWLILMGVRIEFFPSGIWGNLAEIVLSILWLVGITNAYNYLDGVDGLAGGSAVINLVYFSLILYFTGQKSLAVLSLLLCGSILGFLPYNFSKKRKVFLGDSGSTFLGFILAGLSIVGTWAEDSFVKVVIPVLILGVPIFDMTFTTIMRIKEKKVYSIASWMNYTGRDHFHHYLLNLGLSRLGAVIFIYFLNFSLGISAIMVSNDKAWEAVLTLTQVGIIFGIVGVLIVLGRRARKDLTE
ncbi:MAG: undecaprenyl/decaprenyl-phosphate alpha-N-acetylglucosaminyl 1-phosphate transferase [Candidatus Omnitrophica bacterium]|nr:undecaprenyl/decaprenyl-phosphate alpha-N-acetylglucosaminyl 1-phosphate transferase [Candidatus Omnitrophota bacterium]